VASGRLLKKKISDSKQVNDLPDDTCRLLFSWLIAHLDVAGCFYGEPELVKNKVFPRRSDLTVEQVEQYLQILETPNDEYGWPLIIRYQAKGERYLIAPTFANHQGFRRDLHDKSEFPLPPNNIVQKLKRSSPEVKQKLSTSADKDRDRDQDKDKDKDKDKSVDDLKLIAKGMQFPPDVAQVVAEFVSTLPKLGKKRCESTFTELKAMYSQLCHLERTTGELYESLFVEALQEAIKHGGKSIRYVQTIIDSEIARHEEEKAAQQEDADQTRRVSESGMRGGGEFEKIGDVL